LRELGDEPIARTVISIQALRALAAAAVAIVHFETIWQILVGNAGGPVASFPLSSGVDVFFVISGFIMVFSSEQFFAAPGGSLEFFTRRLARIVPLYWLTSVVAIFVMSLPFDWSSLVKSALFIPYQKPNGSIVPLHGVGWTLNYEMFFYFLFSIAILWPRRTAIFVVCLALTSIVITASVFPPTLAPLIYWSNPIILEFAMGVLIAFAYRSDVRIPRLLRLCLALAALGSIWFSTGYMPPSLDRVLFWGVPAAVLVACAVLGTRRQHSQWITAPVKLLGDASYSLYLIHPIVGAVVIVLWSQGLNQYPIKIVLPAALLLSQALAIAIFLELERPTTRWLINRITRRVASSSGDPSREISRIA
jgi:exopolysaccharide production protein ExoZ